MHNTLIVLFFYLSVMYSCFQVECIFILESHLRKSLTMQKKNAFICASLLKNIQDEIKNIANSLKFHGETILFYVKKCNRSCKMSEKINEKCIEKM